MRSKYVTAFVVVLVLGLQSQHLLAATDFNQILADFEKQYQLPSGCLAKIAKVESGGNPNATNRGSSATGLFQWLSNSWLSATKALFGRPLDLSKRYDPVESARVTAFALRDAKNKMGSLIAQAKTDECLGLYMSHFLGTAGATKFFQAYLQNPNQSACGIFPKECSANGSVLNRTLAGVLQNFAQKLNVNSNIQLAGNYEDTNGVPFSRSYANLLPTNFLPANAAIGTDPGRTYPTNYYSGPGTSYAPTGVSSPISQELLNQSNVVTVTTADTPAALIIVQRKSVMRGQPVAVSWTSVRTSVAKPCQVSLDIGGVKTPIAESNEGTKLLSTKKDDAAGTWTLVLQCTNSLGSPLPEQTVSVVLQ